MLLFFNEKKNYFLWMQIIDTALNIPITFTVNVVFFSFIDFILNKLIIFCWKAHKDSNDLCIMYASKRNGKWLNMKLSACHSGVKVLEK